MPLYVYRASGEEAGHTEPGARHSVVVVVMQTAAAEPHPAGDDEATSIVKVAAAVSGQACVVASVRQADSVPLVLRAGTLNAPDAGHTAVWRHSRSAHAVGVEVPAR